jgi:hypothetical protein
MKLTAHWELKIVSLFLAVALYIYTSGQVRVEKTFAVIVTDAAVRGLPADYQVVNLSPREFKVVLSVPTIRLADLESESLSPRLEVRPEQLATKTATWPLTSHLLRLSNDIRVVSSEPADLREIQVQLDRITEESLPVEIPNIAGLAAGLNATVRLDQTLVRVAAGGAVLDLLRRDHERVRFQDIDLHMIDANLVGERQERLFLTPMTPPSETPFRVLGQVAATVTIRPLLAMSKEISTAVQVLCGKDLLRSVDVTLTPPRVTLTVRGPQNLLAQLKPEDLTAFVRLKDDVVPDATQMLPVEVLAPPWLAVDPAQVSVTLSGLTKP